MVTVEAIVKELQIYLAFCCQMTSVHETMVPKPDLEEAQEGTVVVENPVSF